MKMLWYGKECYILNRNRAIDLLIRKADRADAFWAKVDSWFRRMLWKQI